MNCRIQFFVDDKVLMLMVSRRIIEALLNFLKNHYFAPNHAENTCVMINKWLTELD